MAIEQINLGTVAQDGADGDVARVAFTKVNANFIDLENRKANTSTQIIAGTGLTGGGTLAANRTLAVSYGTTAGTAAQGNDSRLSNAREWTAATVDQAEAEAGTATTRRAWTAQRVAQAVRAAVLTGLSTASAAAVTATDSVLIAMGKLQAQINGLSTNKLDTTATAADSSKLNGQDASYYATSAQVGDIATALDLINGEVI